MTVPGLIGHGNKPAYDWNITTAPQEFLNHKPQHHGLGHVVGGSSIVNGLVTTRGAQADYDSWEELGNPGWGWHDLLPYFIKVCLLWVIKAVCADSVVQSENYTVGIDSKTADSLSIHPNMSFHGTSGLLQVTYPKFFYPHSGMFPLSFVAHT